MAKRYIVVFTHVEYDQKLTIDPVWGESGSDAINEAKQYLQDENKWDVESVNRKVE